MQKEIIYDLNTEAVYTPEELDVFGMVWNQRGEDRLVDKVVLRDGTDLVIVPRKTAARQIWLEKMFPRFVLALFSVMVVILLIVSMVVLCQPGKATFWRVVLAVSALPVPFFIIEKLLGGK